MKEMCVCRVCKYRLAPRYASPSFGSKGLPDLKEGKGEVEQLGGAQPLSTRLEPSAARQRRRSKTYHQ